MTSRPQYRPSDAWRTTRTAALCPALAVLLTMLVICLGAAAHAASDLAAAPMTSMAATQTPSGHPAEHCTVTATQPGDVPGGDMCCAQEAHGVRAVLPTPAQPAPAVLPRIPSNPGPAALTCSLGLTPTRGAPDLHVLQVQRT
ncbi:hypothetical protein [Streptomyces sp. NPDC020362]|uniref:hypothetical protein n=1 Tax=unclassified Streptomyces TaxID=2593676 RepID=UPI00340DB4B3